MILYYLLLLALPFIEHPRMPSFGFGITPVKILGVVVAFAAVLRILGRSTPAYLWRWREIWLFLALFVIALLSAVATGLTPSAALPAGSYLAFAVLYVATMAFVDSPERLRKACILTMTSLLVASVLVFREYVRWNVPRPGGALRDPNYYGLAVIPILPMVILFLLNSRGLLRWFLTLTALLLAASTLLGASRGALLGLGVVGLYLFLRSRKKFLLASAGGCALLLILFLLPRNPLDRFLNPGMDAVSSSEVRSEILVAGWRMIQEYPLTGIGIGQFRSQSTRYNPDLPVPKVAHSTYLSIAAELGLPALGLFVAILFLSWRRARRLVASCRENGMELGECVALAIETGIAAYAVTATFLTGEYSKQLWLLVFWGTALNRLVLLSPGSALPAPSGLGVGSSRAISGGLPPSPRGRRVCDTPRGAAAHPPRRPTARGAGASSASPRLFRPPPAALRKSG